MLQSYTIKSKKVGGKSLNNIGKSLKKLIAFEGGVRGEKWDINIKNSFFIVLI